MGSGSAFLEPLDPDPHCDPDLKFFSYFFHVENANFWKQSSFGSGSAIFQTLYPDPHERNADPKLWLYWLWGGSLVKGGTVGCHGWAGGRETQAGQLHTDFSTCIYFCPSFWSLFQCFTSQSVRIRIYLASWIQIRIGNTDPDPGDLKLTPKNE